MECEIMDKAIEEENDREMTLVHFRAMPPRRQKDLLLALMDEYVALAKEGKLEKTIVGQVYTRAWIVAQFFGIAQDDLKLGTLRMIRNG